jgi:hypothetical protein
MPSMDDVSETRTLRVLIAGSGDQSVIDYNAPPRRKFDALELLAWCSGCWQSEFG